MKRTWILAGLLGAAGGFSLGRYRQPALAVPRQGISLKNSSRFIVPSALADQTCSPATPPTPSASFPFWSFPAALCQSPQVALHAASARANLSSAIEADTPVCASALRKDYFLVTSGKGQFARIDKAAHPFGFAYYRGETPQPIGDHSLIHGVPMEVGEMRVSESPDVVLVHYAKQFALNDIRPIAQLLQGESGPLSLSFQLGRDDQHVLILVPTADGTLVLAALGNKLEKLPGQSQLPASFPHPTDIKNVSVDGIVEGKSLQRDIAFTDSVDIEHLRSFYQDELEHRGFQLEPGAVAKPDSWQQGFYRNDQVIHISAHAEPSGGSSVNVIWVTHPLTGD